MSEQETETDIFKLIDSYNRFREETYGFALANVIEPLSKAVIAYGQGHGDRRSLLDVARQTIYGTKMTRETTPQFNNWVAFNHRMTVAAQCQVSKINNAGYCVPEMISMMLEQCDYWETDCHLIIEMATAYLKGEFGP